MRWCARTCHAPVYEVIAAVYEVIAAVPSCPGCRRIRDGEPIGPGEPLVTAGYSGRPQAAKLGLKPEQRVHLHHPPPGWALTDPPAGLTDPGPDGRSDV